MTKTSTYCSKRLGKIEHGKFQTALSRMDLGELEAVIPITAGNFGQNVFLVTDRGDFVFRGCPHYPWQFPKERRFANLLHEKAQVPVPWPYLLDHDSSLFGWPYVIMPRMPGMQLDDECSGQGMTHDDRLGIAAAMGRTLAALQSLTHEFCGEYDPYSDGLKPFGCSHSEYVGERLLAGLHSAGETICLQDREWVNRLFERAKPFLDSAFTPTFVMQDFKGSNVVVQKAAGQWVVSGVFDFMEPFFADGEMDLCRNMCCYVDSDSPDLAATFVAAYAGERLLRHGAIERFPVYLLLDRLIVWNFGWRHGRPWWDEKMTFREWIDLDHLLDVFQQHTAADCAAP